MILVKFIDYFKTLIVEAIIIFNNFEFQIKSYDNNSKNKKQTY